MESDFIFGSVLGRDVLPFVVERVRPVLVPVAPLKEGGLRLLNTESALKKGAAGLAEWLKEVEREWARLKKRGSKLSIYQRLNYHNLLTSQSPREANRVIFTAAGAHLTAAVLTEEEVATKLRGIKIAGVVVEHKFYTIRTETPEEAYYLAAILNSPAVDRLIKPHQTVGLFGARDIERRALEVVPIPLYVAKNQLHQEMAAQGRTASAEAKKIYGAFASLPTGRRRGAIRKALKIRLREIDKLVAKLVGAEIQTAKSQRKVIRGQAEFNY